MTKEQFLERRAALYEEIKALKREYALSNVTVQPGRMVTVNGHLRCWLQDYKVVDGKIYPVLYKLRKDGSPSKSCIYVSNNANIQEVKL